MYFFSPIFQVAIDVAICYFVLLFCIAIFIRVPQNNASLREKHDKTKALQKENGMVIVTEMARAILRKVSGESCTMRHPKASRLSDF